jgi:hypothetical protein
MEQIERPWSFEWGVNITPRPLPKPILEESPEPVPTLERTEFMDVKGIVDTTLPVEVVPREILLRQFRKVRGV